MVPPDIRDSRRSRAALAVPEATKRFAATTANKSTAVLSMIQVVPSTINCGSTHVELS